jgi:DNA-directed RNA polymerase specialized sigma24 family protein
MTAVDTAYVLARAGSHAGFAEWVRLVELGLRRSLRGFSRQVDVESIVQEGLLRMWVLAPRLSLDGENASLRYALRLVRNLALREAQRMKTFAPIDGPGADEGGGGDGGSPPGGAGGGAGRAGAEDAVLPDPPSDPGLRKAILDCIGRLPRGNRRALVARLEGQGEIADRDIAADLRMKLNTFLQNIVRARALLRKCLGSRGIAVEEFLR